MELGHGEASFKQPGSHKYLMDKHSDNAHEPMEGGLAPSSPLPIVTDVKQVTPAAANVPDAQSLSFILDANVLFNLAAPRPGGGSWLDLLPAIAAAPGVKNIYIPAIIADWELRNGTSSVQNGHLDFEILKPPKHDVSEHDKKAIDAFLKKATRIQLREDGTQHIIQPSQAISNIVIYETPFDRKFLDTALEINHNNALSKVEKIARYKILEDISAQVTNYDLGERAMEHMAQQLPHEGAVYLVTDDIKFLKNRTNITTKHGYPVSESTLSYFLAPAFFSRNSPIQKFLNKEGLKDMSLPQIMQSIAQNRFGSRYDHCHTYIEYQDVPGRYKAANGSTRQGETLSQFWARSGVLTEGGIPTYTLPEPAGDNSHAAKAQQSRTTTNGEATR